MRIGLQRSRLHCVQTRFIPILHHMGNTSIAKNCSRRTERRADAHQTDRQRLRLTILDPKVAKQQMHDCGQSWEGVEVGQEEGGGETGPQQSDHIWAGQPNPSKKYGRNPPTPQNASPLCPLCSIPHPPPVTANVQSINRDTTCKPMHCSVYDSFFPFSF